MIWKDEYKLGNELVDTQHKELFTRVEALNNIIVRDDAAAHKQKCIDAILFLKDYAVSHFAAEERFQEELGYRFIDFHKAIHKSFIESVLAAEQALVESDFSLPAIKDFCGFLTTWLVYHVAGADRKIISDDVMTVAEFAITVSYEDCVLESLKSVLYTILGTSLDAEQSDQTAKIEDAVEIVTQYDDARDMSFTLSKKAALSLVNAIANLHLTEIDELANAVLMQFAKTICGNAATRMSKHGQTADEIKISKDSLIAGGNFFINTKFGRVSFAFIDK